MNSPHAPKELALESAEFRVRQAGEWLGLEDGLIETIIAPRRVLEVSIPFRRDNGTRDHLVGWRVHHSSNRNVAEDGDYELAARRCQRWHSYRP